VSHEPLLDRSAPKRFDVICAGEAIFQIVRPSLANRRDVAPRLEPGGGAVTAALALAKRGLSVGLATVLDDDSVGRRLHERVVAAGIDVGGVALTPRQAGLVRVDAAGELAELGAARGPARQLEVPEHWSAQVLLLSGLSPVVAHAAALCKAARAARRKGVIVVVDVHARWHLWAGQDARAIRSILREADVVRLSVDDAAVLRLDVDALRGAMRESAVLVMSQGADDAWARGPFGYVSQPPRRGAALPALGPMDAFTTAICDELARAGEPAEDRPDVWARALRQGHAAVWGESASR
jgi:sugar/nucleoside kinase (ribokinase family)